MSSNFDAWPFGNDSTTAGHLEDTSEEPYRNGIYLSAMAIFSCLIIGTNSVVVIVVAYSDDLHLPTLWNTAFMASCDLLYGLHYMIFAIPSLYMGKFAYSESMIKPASFSMTLLFGQNIFNILLSVVDRYIAVCWPLRYVSLMSARRFWIAVSSLIAMNIIRLCLMIFPKSVVYYNKELGFCVVNFEKMTITASSLGVPFLSSVFITALLIKIGTEFRRKRRVHPIDSTSQSTQFTVTMSLAALVYIVCYIPTCASIIMAVVFGKDDVNIVLLQAATLIVLSNSFWNVVIYATTYRPFRIGFLKLFLKKLFREQARREVNIALGAGTASSARAVRSPNP